MFKFSKTVTYFKNDKDEWVIYNWFNSSYAVIFDKNHPLFKILDNNGISDNMSFDSKYFDNYKEDLTYLIDNHIFIKQDNCIDDKITQQFSEHRDIHNNFSLIILPAGEACNFNCVYCYEDHSQKHRMDQKHSNAIYSLFQNVNSKVNHIEYFGGEPLLNSKFILDLNSKLTRWSKDNNIKFTSSATTNGYLLSPMLVEQLYDVNLFSYQITLDGLEQHHNSLRPLANGRGTFSRIVENLAYIVSRKDLKDIRIMLRCNYNEKTSSDDDIHKFLLFIYNLINGDNRFSVIFRGIGDYSSTNGKNGNNDSLCSKELSGELRMKYEDKAQNLNIPLGEITTSLTFGSASCYASKPNNFVISPDFSIKKCTVALDKPINNIGKLDFEGNFTFNENFKLWVEQNLFGKEDCKKCHFISQCNSNACPLLNIERGFPVCPPSKLDSVRIINQFLKHVGE